MNTLKKKIRLNGPSQGPKSPPSSSGETEIFIGLDISLTDTGLSVIDDCDAVLHVESIRTDSTMLDQARVNFIVNKIIERCVSYATDHKVRVCIEAIPFARNPSGKSYTRTEIVGVLKYLLTRAGIDTYLVGATTLKSKFANKGTADKADIQAAVYNRFHRLVKNENVADAIGCAAICSDYINKRLKLTIQKLPEFNQ